MKARSSRRRGTTMIVVVVLMTLVGGAITAMTFNASYLYRSQKLERSRCILRAMAESATAYVYAHRDSWLSAPPHEPIRLDMTALTPANAEATAEIEMNRLTVQLTWGSTHIENEIDLDLNGKPTTQPASSTNQSQ